MAPTPEILKTNPPPPPTAEELRGRKTGDKVNELKSCSNCNFSKDNNYCSPCRRCIHTDNNPFPNWEPIPKQTQYEKLLAKMTIESYATDRIFAFMSNGWQCRDVSGFFISKAEALQAEIDWLNSKVLP